MRGSKARSNCAYGSKEEAAVAGRPRAGVFIASCGPLGASASRAERPQSLTEVAIRGSKARPGAQCPSRSGRGVGAPEPGCRVNRFAAPTDLKIQLRRGSAAGVPGSRDGFASGHRLSGRLEQSVIMSIQAHVALAVINNFQ